MLMEEQSEQNDMEQKKRLGSKAKLETKVLISLFILKINLESEHLHLL